LADRVSSKKEVRRRRRQEEKDRRARSARTQNLLVWGGLAVIVAIAGLAVFQAVNPAAQPGTAVLDQGNQHVNSPDEVSSSLYNTVPPTSGPHMPSLAPWGVSTEPIANAYQIHNLEDGGVNMQYDCPDGCPELVEQLTAFANEVLSDASLIHPTTRSTHFILAPYSGIRDASGGKPIALTAWTRIQYFDTVDREEMLKFIRAYINIDHHVRGIG
jgi:hypothetical protein